jgi:hypothetical protein
VVILKIKIKRGLKGSMPILEEGELAYTLDEQTVYIGTSSGNKGLTAGQVKGKVIELFPTSSDGTIFWLWDETEQIYYYNWTHNMDCKDLIIQQFEILDNEQQKQVFIDDVIIQDNNNVRFETSVNLHIKIIVGQVDKNN